MKKLIRITTVPVSLRTLLKGQLKFMSQHFEVIGVSSAGSAMNEVIMDEGIKTHVVEMSRSITPIIDLKSTYQLYKYFKKERPFIVHTHTPKAGTLGMFAAKLAGVPHRIHTIAGLPLLETTGFKRKLLDVVERFTYICATHVLPNSFALEKIILDNGFTNPKKLQVIGKGSSNGIDTAHYNSDLISEIDKSNLRRELNIAETEIVFIFVGRLVTDKGINELVNAFDELSKTDKNCKLLLVGPKEDNLDPLLPETENLILNNKHILEVGTIKDIRPYVCISHVLVFPSYREGFPNVVLQASCMDLPCIVTDINGCNEIIEHNVNGLIIPAKDQKSLLGAMQFMLDHPERQKEMSLHCRSRIVKNYQQEYVWKSLLELYRSLEKQ
ncbi:MAG: glycosyltransferase family 4 protein [Aquaticitalea sp.]